MTNRKLATKRKALLERINRCGSCAVAFSGGVDSAVVAQAAHLTLAENAVAITGVSPSLAPSELDLARKVASQIGIRHVEIKTEEFNNPQYVQNDAHRCFHCKTELYTHLTSFCRQHSIAFVANGANVDDLDDYRPGLKAACDFHVISPLADCGLNKHEIRQLAEQWRLPIWDKPASPCLASRIAYGEKVTPERLRMVDEAESFLRQLGLREVRVRYHRGDVARIEMPNHMIQAFFEHQKRASLVDFLKALGFRFVTVDLEGFRSGSLNTMVSVDQIVLPKSAER